MLLMLLVPLSTLMKCFWQCGYLGKNAKYSIPFWIGMNQALNITKCVNCVIHYDWQMIHYSVISMKLKHVFFEYNKNYSQCIHISFVHSMVDYYGSVVLIYVVHLLVQRTNLEADYPKNLRINYLHSPYIFNISTYHPKSDINDKWFIPFNFHSDGWHKSRYF